MIQLIEASKGNTVFIKPSRIITIHKTISNMTNSIIQIEHGKFGLTINVKEEPHEVVDKMNKYFKGQDNDKTPK